MNMDIAQNKNGLSVQKAVPGGMGKSHRAFYQGLLSEGINTQNPQTVTLKESRISCSASLQSLGIPKSLVEFTSF